MKNLSYLLQNLVVSKKEILTNNPGLTYNLLTDKFHGVVNKHVPLKKNFERVVNNAPFYK